ncbi:MAG: DMT family transporter, partial [Brachymonas sp.]|nr:DMT family transporter [Brachymonas sp.]
SFLMALLFLRDEPLNARSFTGLLLGFAGVLLIAQPWKSDVSQINLAGVMYMVAGSLSVGCSFVYARKFLSPLGISSVALCTYQIGIALLMLLCVTDLRGASHLFDDTRAAIGLIVGLGLTGTGLAYILYYYIVRHLGAVTAAGATYIPPVMALLIGAVAGEPVSALGVVAMVLILLGVFILQTSRRVAR